MNIPGKFASDLKRKNFFNEVISESSVAPGTSQLEGMLTLLFFLHDFHQILCKVLMPDEHI